MQDKEKTPTDQQRLIHSDSPPETHGKKWLFLEIP